MKNTVSKKVLNNVFFYYSVDNTSDVQVYVLDGIIRSVVRFLVNKLLLCLLLAPIVERLRK